MNFETKAGELDRIYLKDVIRRDFKKYANGENLQLVNEPGEPLQIPTATFSLKYENILNMSLSFIVIEEEENISNLDMPPI